VPPPQSRAPPDDAGVRLIVLYKAVKAVAEVALALGLLALAATGEIATVREGARALREHVASRWSVALGRALASVASPHGLHLAELALLLDGALSALEGYGLWRSRAWGPWLVVAATLIFVSFLAIVVPAKRATAVDPAVALRNE